MLARRLRGQEPLLRVLLHSERWLVVLLYIYIYICIYIYIYICMYIYVYKTNYHVRR